MEDNKFRPLHGTPEEIGNGLRKFYDKHYGKDNHMLIKIDDNYAVEIKDLDEREYAMLKMCEQYEKNPFGAPNHLLMMLVIKLWNYIKGYNE